MRTRGPVSMHLALLLLLAAASWGCSDKCQSCPDCGVEAEDIVQDEAEEEAAVDVTPDDVTGEGVEEVPVCSIPDVDCDVGLHPEYGLCVADTELLSVAAGAFTMGHAGGEDNPEHSVTLAAFLIDQFEVTNRKYQACVELGCCTPPQYDGSYTGRQPYYGNPDFDNFPVIFVDWFQAQEYCQNLGKTLPTEAQWEKAARGDDVRTYPWGNTPPTPTGGYANYSGAIDGDTEEVGTHTLGTSPFGASDMAGNVWEWVGDWYSDTYYASSPAADPAGPDSGIAKVGRGGGFTSHASDLQTFFRQSYHPAEAFSNLGFRCAQTE